MKKILSLLVALVCMSSYGQKEADWQFATEGKPVALFNHGFTGIPIAETTTHYYGINYVDKKPLWTIAKGKLDNALKTAEQVSSMTGMDAGITKGEDFIEIPFTPFASIKNKFIDISTGNILLGEGDNSYSSIIDNTILAELYVLLLKVKASNGSKMLYCIDLQNKTVSWKTKLAEANALKDVAKSAASGTLSSFNSFAPKATKDKSIVYKNDKTLFLIDSKNGNIKWQNECNPGTFFLDPSQSHLIVVKQASGVGNAMKMSLSSFGKSMFALDIATGKQAWKNPIKLDEKFTSQINFNANSFIAAHKKGINIYDYKTGTATWKKDFQTKRVQEMTVEKDGIKVFYGNRIMLVDVATGKKAWKKPIVFDDMSEDEEGSVIKKSYGSNTYIVSSDFTGLFDSKTGKKTWKMSISEDAKTAFDNKNNKVAVVDGKKFYLFNPIEVSKKPEKIKLDIKKSQEIIGFETFDDGYFITGTNEFIALDKKAGLISHKYYRPLKTDRLLKAALITSSVTTGILAIEVSSTNPETGETVSGGLFMSKENARAMGEISAAQTAAIRRLRAEAKMRGAVRSSGKYAYFLKGENIDGVDKMSIMKVNKSNGKEEDSLDFGNDRKVIFELHKASEKLFLLEEGNLKAFEL